MKKGLGMKTNLYDFSISTAVIVCLAYAFMLTFLGYLAFSEGVSVIAAILFFLILVSFLFVVAYFVVLSPRIKGKYLIHGNKRIKLKELKYKAVYDTRFKEQTIVFWNRKTEIKYLSNKEYDKKTIRVQATPSNVRKIELWTGDTITVPEKPKAKNPFRKK